MYLKYVNILYFIILTYLCLWICALEIGMEQYRLFIYKGSKDCIITLPQFDFETPMIYDPETNLTVYPNRQSHIILKFNTSIRLSCVGNHFVSPFYREDISEITVKCINRHLLRYNDSDYSLESYRCQRVPVASLIPTDQMCQVYDGVVMNVGFETKNKFSVLYRLCFHTEKKTTLYTWYYLDVPRYRYIQNTTTKPKYIKTESFKPIDVEAAYANQQETVAKIIGSNKLAKWYIQYVETKEHEGVRYLLKGHLMSISDFVYTHEQHATYFYENTAPQWLIYKESSRRDIEKYFKRYVYKHNAKHLIVSGTYLISSPLNNSLIRCPLYLELPNKMPVPEFFWRMDYNLETKKGIVFLGFNGPWKSYEMIRQICLPTACPNRLKRKTFIKDMFYCCTKESFEQTYGKLDPVVYEEF